MKYGVVDIGSNSVRLMISIDDVTESKFIKTTRLAEKMGDSCILQFEPMNRTAQAVSFFVEKAKELGADKIYVFATAAVRQATNKQEFLELVRKLCSINVDVISGDMEASLGALGAVQDNGGIIDVGGASSEVMVVKDAKTVFSRSLDVGAVKLTDKFGQDKEKIISFIDKKVEEYGNIPITNFFGIGGTATTLASIDQKMKVYDPKLVHGYSISIERIKEIRDMLFSMSLEQRQELDGLQKERALVIPSGVALIYRILTKAGAQKITISERDNLEGYLMIKRSQNE
ncbi:MAG: Ppx/GppA family phosphatase [Clostridiales bacterium]|nr:Ppx/GppA family phosphatase [Clostridiales bacterium]